MPELTAPKGKLVTPWFSPAANFFFAAYVLFFAAYVVIEEEVASALKIGVLRFKS